MGSNPIGPAYAPGSSKDSELKYERRPLCQVHVRAAATAYILAVLSVTLYWYWPQYFHPDLFGGYPPDQTAELMVGVSAAIFGMVLFPYFGAGSLVHGPGSVWAKTYRLLNGHISFPFIGGVSLAYLTIPFIGTGFPLSGLPLIAVYVLFSLAATVLVVMANRPGGPAAPETPSQ